MATISMKRTRQLESILADLARANDYIGKESTALAVRTDVTMMPEHTLHRKSDGAQFAIMQKAYGSDLCGLPTGIKRLREWIVANGKTV